MCVHIYPHIQVQWKGYNVTLNSGLLDIISIFTFNHLLHTFSIFGRI